jgi:hypothetical protein
MTTSTNRALWALRALRAHEPYFSTYQAREKGKEVATKCPNCPHCTQLPQHTVHPLGNEAPHTPPARRQRSGARAFGVAPRRPLWSLLADRGLVDIALTSGRNRPSGGEFERPIEVLLLAGRALAQRLKGAAGRRSGPIELEVA